MQNCSHMNTMTLADFQICISVPLIILFKLWERLFHGTPPSGSDDRMLKRCFLANKYMLIFLHGNISCFY